MERSIEEIWKTGFLDNKALVAPIVNDLYIRKSEHVIDKFNRMFRFNLKAIVFGGILGLPGLFLLKLPIVGIVLFITLAVVFLVNKRELVELETIDKSLSCFAYLKSFNSWMHNMVSLNAGMARIYYPAVFLGTALGVWFSVHGPILYALVAGDQANGWLVNGIPGLLMIPVVLIAFSLWVFGERFYRMELNAFYGRVLKKLDELLAEMENLRADQEDAEK